MEKLNQDKVIQFKEYPFWKISDIIQYCTLNYVKMRLGFVKFFNMIKKNAKPREIQRNGYFFNHHFVQTEYAIIIPLFIKSFMQFNQLQLKYYNKWKEINNLEKVYSLLYYIFVENQKAHERRRGKLKSKYYSIKNNLLEKAIQYGQTLLDILPSFSFGKGYDSSAINYENIIYFQFGDYQISFHSEYSFNIPDFKGKWNGKINTQFPFAYTDLEKLFINQFSIIPKTSVENIELTELAINGEIAKYQLNRIKEEPKIEKIMEIKPKFKTILDFI